MDFFDKLGATITTKSKDVVQKTKDIAEIVKLNGQIANEEDAVRNAYLQIGKWYLLGHEGELHCEAAQWAQAIRQAQEKIERCQEQIFKLKGLPGLLRPGGRGRPVLSPLRYKAAGEAGALLL